MNSICELCLFHINEGEVCRSCRKQFKRLSINEGEFDRCLKCERCDYYNFPCRRCAKYAFGYSLGSGNGPSDDIIINQESVNIINMGENEQVDTKSDDIDRSESDCSFDEYTGKSYLVYAEEPPVRVYYEALKEHKPCPGSLVGAEMAYKRDTKSVDINQGESTQASRDKKGYYSRYCSIQ